MPVPKSKWYHAENQGRKHKINNPVRHILIIQQYTRVCYVKRYSLVL